MLALSAERLLETLPSFVFRGISISLEPELELRLV